MKIENNLFFTLFYDNMADNNKELERFIRYIEIGRKNPAGSLMSYIYGDEGMKILVSDKYFDVFEKITYLRAEDCNITDKGAIMLADALKKSKCAKNIAYFNLKSNQIGDKGIKALAEVIPLMTSLIRLYIQGNTFSPDSAMCVLRNFSIDSALVDVNLWNWSMGREFYDWWTENIREFYYGTVYGKDMIKKAHKLAHEMFEAGDKFKNNKEKKLERKEDEKARKLAYEMFENRNKDREKEEDQGWENKFMKEYQDEVDEQRYRFDY